MLQPHNMYFEINLNDDDRLFENVEYRKHCMQKRDKIKDLNEIQSFGNIFNHNKKTLFLKHKIFYYKRKINVL